MKVILITQCRVCKRLKKVDGEWSHTDIYEKIIESVEEGMVEIISDICRECQTFDGVFAERSKKKEVKIETITFSNRQVLDSCIFNERRESHERQNY